ncbi:MAG: HEAT repeat domain-containing protein [Verrucomicrobia bacterium]|nr:HEAT repeat domain-containing protein [Verrucomicrobiota bacterium]
MPINVTWPARACVGLAAMLAAAAGVSAADLKTAARPRGVASIRVPAGMIVEEVAREPLVKYPLFACFDDRGRLFVAEGTGTNLPGPQLLPLKLGKIVLLEDTDGDGRFDSSKVFADQLVFPQGVLWRNGALYVASHPSIWRLEDTDGDGVADKRTELIGKFGFTGNGCDIHGPFASPDGWLYWTDGRHGYRIQTREGALLEGLAARVFRCRVDGSGIERVAGGAFDNPVELIFTETGDLIGTMDQGGPGDMLLHYIEGGVYPRDDNPTVKEFPRTGPPLPPIVTFSPALPAGLCGLLHLRSGYFGPEYQGTVLSTQFNLHLVQQHVLTREGTTFRSVNKDFFVSSDDNFHLTDVLEDADGSLLVVDMGAWFSYGCPGIKIAQPTVTGTIYRVRRADAPPMQDPWGKSLKLDAMPPTRLVELLNEPRVKVREEVVERLVKLGAPAVEALAAEVRRDGKRTPGPARPAPQRREALWILSRINTPMARAAVREALADADATLRQVAVHCVSVERDADALSALTRMVVDDEPPLRLKAAEALGRLGRHEAVPALLASLGAGVRDRYLEHALIYALINVGDFQATLVALGDSRPHLRRAGLIALDQMHGTQKPMSVPAGEAAAKDNPFRGKTFEYLGNTKLTRQQVAPLLDTDDGDLQQTALEVISRRPGWSDEIVLLAAQWLRSAELDLKQQQALAGTLLAFCDQEKVQQLVSRALEDPATSENNRRLLFGVMARCRLEQLPAAWFSALDQTLRNAVAPENAPAVVRDALHVIRSRKLARFDQPLAAIADRAELPADLRVSALACFAPRATLSVPVFKLLTAQLAGDIEPLLQVTAATALGAAQLNHEQLLKLARHVAQAGPLVAPLLTPAFLTTQDTEAGLALVAALKQSAGARALTGNDLAALVDRFSPEVSAAAQPLFEQRASALAQQEKYLAELGARMELSPGDSQRGERVYYSNEAGCYACHGIQGKGGKLGPDLSQVGRFRTPRALLEAIVFPSASIADDFRLFVIADKSGATVVGMIARETADAIYLRTPQLAEVRIVRGDIKSLAALETSLMPEGLEKMLTPQQLSDLVEYLFERR